jgi:hypothetical protein
MKKTNIAILICITCIALQSRAQDRKVEIGATAAPSLTFLYGNDIAQNTGQTIGFAAGASFQYNFTRLISLHTEILYERKGNGGKVTYTDAVGNPTFTRYVFQNIDYVSIPVLARVSVGKKVKFIAEAGPYVGIFAQAAQDIHDPLTNKIYLKKIDAGASVGLGISIPIKDKFAFNIEARNNTGLLNISTLPVYHDGTLRTNTTNLLFSFIYKIGKKKT